MKLLTTILTYVFLIFLSLFIGHTNIDLVNHIFSMKYPILGYGFLFLSTIWLIAELIIK